MITFGDDDYIVGWYAKNKKVIGCVINLNLIFRTIRAKTEEYDVIPFMVDARGRVMTQADTSEKYKNEIIDFSKAGKKKEKNATVYSYQLGTVGKINLMVLPGGGILENVLIMQIAFVVLIAVLLVVCCTGNYSILPPDSGTAGKIRTKTGGAGKEQSLRRWKQQSVRAGVCERQIQGTAAENTGIENCNLRKRACRTESRAGIHAGTDQATFFPELPEPDSWHCR